MRKLITLFTVLFISFAMTAQNNTSIETSPQVAITGVGKVSIVPDQVVISFGVESRADDAATAKKTNDAAVAKVIAYVKSMKIADKDYQTQRVNLYKNRDYETKQDYYQATQTMVITLKDLKKYEELMVGLMEAGINQIQGVDFRSSKIEDYQTEVRTKAVADAKKKAEDYAKALEQSVGKAIYISDQSGSVMPMPRTMMLKGYAADSSAMEETLAIGEIEITASVSIRFTLN